MTYVYKSFETLTATEEAVATAQIAQVLSAKATTQASGDKTESELLFTHINGELRLLERYTVLEDGCCACQAEYVYYDAITNEVIV